MEKTNGKLDPKQRETLAQMLKDAKSNEERRLENSDGISTRSILRALAEKAGALKLVEKVEELESQKKRLVRRIHG
jgi:cell division protein FtsN